MDINVEGTVNIKVFWSFGLWWLEHCWCQLPIGSLVVRSCLEGKAQISYSELSHLWNIKSLTPRRHIFKHRTNNPLNTKIKILTWELCCLVHLTNIYECIKLSKKCYSNWIPWICTGPQIVTVRIRSNSCLFYFTRVFICN